MVQSSAKLRVDKTTTARVTMLSLHGTVDASFEAARVGAMVNTNALVLSLREVRRFSSWGMSEWVTFLKSVDQKDLYFVECSAYSAQQMHQVTGLIGHGKIVSFYASYRCNRCGEEFDSLVTIGDDPRTLANIEATERACVTCGGLARMPKFSAEVSQAIIDRNDHDIDDDVAGFLRERLKYDIKPNLTRLRAYKRTHGEYTYLRLQGNLASISAASVANAVRDTTIVDVGGALFDPAHLDPWFAFLTAAKSRARSLQLLDCQVGFLGTAVRAEDLDASLVVRTFAQPYVCASCGTTTLRMIDVAENLEHLTMASLPATTCSKCRAAIAGPPPDRMLPLHRLPARAHDLALDKFLAKTRGEPNEKLENATATHTKPTAPSGSTVTRSVFIGSALAAVLVGGIALGAALLWPRDSSTHPSHEAPGSAGPVFPRPDWIVSDTPSSSFCQETIGKLSCVGISAYSANRDEASADANDAALEEVVNTLAVKIDDPWFRDNVLASYSSARTKALAANTSPGAGTNPAVRASRHRIVEILQASGGPAVPPQRSDWYWEEYEKEKGKGAGTEFLVFVRYDLTPDALKSLVLRYSSKTQVGTSSVVTAFPGLAWHDADFSGGVMLVKVGAELANAGVAPGHVIASVNDQRVQYAGDLSKALEGHPDAKLNVRTPNGVSRVVQLKH